MIARQTAGVAVFTLSTVLLALGQGPPPPPHPATATGAEWS
jgi:hypothetical protein